MTGPHDELADDAGERGDDDVAVVVAHAEGQRAVVLSQSCRVREERNYDRTDRMWGMRSVSESRVETVLALSYYPKDGLYCTEHSERALN